MSQQIIEDVKDYYGKVLEDNTSLKSTACCPTEGPPEHLKKLLANIHEDVMAKFYGCGTPLPIIEEGWTILDLGSGSGRDAFVLSQLVGEEGKVIGIDMTDEQLEVANKYVGWHMNKFGYNIPNVEFRKGMIEDLQAAGIKDNSIDLVISNCVINLSPDKDAVFREIERVLKPGGQLYFSDVFAGQPIPEALQSDKVLRGECLSGAMYIPEFEAIMEAKGMSAPETITNRQLDLTDSEVQEKIGMIDFYSMTIRSFKGEPKTGSCNPKGGCC